MVKKYNILLVVSVQLLWTFTCFSQFSISGKVILEDSSAIVGATVWVEELSSGTVTDKNGKFIIENVPKGGYQISITSIGLSPINKTYTVSSNEAEWVIIMQERAFDLPQVVIESITMTGGLAGINKTLGSAHYISQKEIQKFSYTDIARTLRNIPGVNVQEEDGFGLRPNIGLRGSGSERSSKITVMEDGVLAAPAPYSAPAAYYFPTIGRMEAIEIMKGSSQIKYGPFTTGGAINLISTPLPTKFSGHADFITGGFGYRMLHANVGNAHKNVSYLVETMQYSADGFKQLDNGGPTGFNKEDYMAKIRFNTNPNAPIYQSLTFKIGQSTEISNETYLGLVDADFDINPLRRYAASAEDIMTTRQEQYTLTHFAALTDFLDIHTTAYRNNFHRNWYKLDKVNGTNISTILDDEATYADALAIIRGDANGSDAVTLRANNRGYYSQGVQTNAILHFNTASLFHKIDIGVRWHHDELDRFQWEDQYNMTRGILQLSQSGTPGTESNRVEDARAFSSYVQYKLEWNKLILTPGLRYEHISMGRLDYGKEDPQRQGAFSTSRENVISVVIPGMSASYELSEYANFFGGVHKGFAPPGSREGTDPEESWNYELGYRYNKSGYRAQILGYYNDYSNLLGMDLAATGGLGTQDLFNGGSARVIGIEAEGSIDLVQSQSGSFRIPLSLAYTYTHSSFENSFESEFEVWGEVQSGDFLPYVPRHQLSTNLSIEHLSFLLDINARYSDAMLAEPGQHHESTLLRTDGAFTVDVAFNYILTKELSAFINVNNLTDNVYIVSRRPAGVRPNMPRTWNVGLKVNF